jgi:hypothetical protein
VDAMLNALVALLRCFFAVVPVVFTLSRRGVRASLPQLREASIALARTLANVVRVCCRAKSRIAAVWRWVLASGGETIVSSRCSCSATPLISGSLTIRSNDSPPPSRALAEVVLVWSTSYVLFFSARCCSSSRAFRQPFGDSSSTDEA